MCACEGTCSQGGDGRVKSKGIDTTSVHQSYNKQTRQGNNSSSQSTGERNNKKARRKDTSMNKYSWVGCVGEDDKLDILDLVSQAML